MNEKNKSIIASIYDIQDYYNLHNNLYAFSELLESNFVLKIDDKTFNTIDEVYKFLGIDQQS